MVLVQDHHANRGSQRDTKLGSRLDKDLVLLISRGGDVALAGTATGHLRLDIFLGELHAGRASVDDAADRAAVGLAIPVIREDARARKAISWLFVVYMWYLRQVNTHVVTRKYSPNVDIVNYIFIISVRLPKILSVFSKQLVVSKCTAKVSLEEVSQASQKGDKDQEWWPDFFF